MWKWRKPLSEEYLEQLNLTLRNRQVDFEPGLTDAEVTQVETRYGFRFPPDLRQFLQYALPISKQWVNWRENDEDIIRERLAWPVEGMCFDIEMNGFWMRAWGDRPTSLGDAVHIAKQAVLKAPFLIPIVGHRYLPDEPNEAGNPVLSVYQTDIIYYGNDLVDYFANEFKYRGPDEEEKHRWQSPRPVWATKSVRPVRFWDDIITGVDVIGGS